MYAQQNQSDGPSVAMITDQHLPQLAKMAASYARTASSSSKFLDIVVPAPKSVSVLWAVEKRDSESALLRGAHAEAVSQAAIDVQRHAGSAKFGPAYLDVVLNIFRLEHYANDRDAPFLHTHLIVDAEARDGGRRGSLDIPTLRESLEIVGLRYQARLEQELWSRLRLAFEERRGGRRQITGIGADLTDTFADGSCRVGFPQFTAEP